MRKRFGKFVLPLLAAVMLGFSVVQVVRTQQTPAAPPPPIEPPRTPFGHTVAGAGIVEAETENISVGSALSGIVLEVYVPVERVGKIVEPGEPLFLVDNRSLKAQLEYQKANLASAEAQLRRLEMQPRPEELPPSEAKVGAAKSNLQMQLDLAERNRQLMGSRSVSQEDYQQKMLATKMARYQYLQAEAEHTLLKAGAWEADKAVARAAVEMAKAQIQQTQTELGRALVRAPVRGKILQVNVRPGEYVGAPPSQALVVLGSVARLHVRVDVDEHDIPRAYPFFRPGVPAYASPHGDPAHKIPLRFVRVEPYVVPKKSLTGDNTERVDTRVLQVIYQLEGSDTGLYVGMQVDAFLNTDPKALTAALVQAR